MFKNASKKLILWAFGVCILKRQENLRYGRRKHLNFSKVLKKFTRKKMVFSIKVFFAFF
jgi:hypothetical protein